MLETAQQPTFSKVGLHANFYAHVRTLKDTLLPHVPSCPGPYLLPDSKALKRPAPTMAFIQQFPREAIWYSTVVRQGKPNYRGAHLTISALPLHIWKTKLRRYHDWQITAFMRYGWSMGYEGSARNQPEHVTKYVDKEAMQQALAGPFCEPPFSWLRVNPMMTRQKKELGNYRVDLFFPGEDSVNGHINKRPVEGAPYKLHLPTPLDLSNLIFKLNLAQAYHQLLSDP